MFILELEEALLSVDDRVEQIFSVLEVYLKEGRTHRGKTTDANMVDQLEGIGAGFSDIQQLMLQRYKTARERFK